MKKRQFRSLWIVRINNGLRANGTTYSAFVHQAKVKKVQLDRKSLAYLAAEQPKAFAAVVQFVVGK
ncbi:MAG: 50S ribosomal protein L20 [Candidatus Andersenbacteria bacterium]